MEEDRAAAGGVGRWVGTLHAGRASRQQAVVMWWPIAKTAVRSSALPLAKMTPAHQGTEKPCVFRALVQILNRAINKTDIQDT